MVDDSFKYTLHNPDGIKELKTGDNSVNKRK